MRLLGTTGPAATMALGPNRLSLDGAGIGTRGLAPKVEYHRLSEKAKALLPSLASLCQSFEEIIDSLECTDPCTGPVQYIKILICNIPV